jgi:hypothetical protein
MGGISNIAIHRYLLEFPALAIPNHLLRTPDTIVHPAQNRNGVHDILQKILVALSVAKKKNHPFPCPAYHSSSCCVEIFKAIGAVYRRLYDYEYQSREPDLGTVGLEACFVGSYHKS